MLHARVSGVSVVGVFWFVEYTNGAKKEEIFGVEFRLINERIIRTVSMLIFNPKLFIMFLKGKVKSLRWNPEKAVSKKIRGVSFTFSFGLDPSIKNMYDGDYEVEVIAALEKILKREDVFIDVGANIGYISAIGAGLVGQTGQVHSFEPVPEHFKSLKKMAHDNPNHSITVNRCALGEECGSGSINIFKRRNIGWNTMVPDYMDPEDIKESIKIPVIRLDDYINDKKIKKIALIKIDVEGMEFSVLRGLSKYFENTDHSTPIICEITRKAPELLGYTHAQLADYMKGYCYSAFSLISMNKVDISTPRSATNVLFLRDGR